MHETDETVAKLFTRGSHHKNVSVVYLAQNLFPKKNKFARTISLNAHYMFLFKNPRDATQFATLARQMYPDKSQFAVEAYKDATREPYSYLLVDVRPEQDDDLRLRYFPERLTTYTPLNEQMREEISAGVKAYYETRQQSKARLYSQV